MEARLVAAIHPTWKRVEKASQETASVLGYMLMPVALAGYALAIWRIAADMKWLGEFFVARGLFSHWQVWLAMGIAVHMLATQLNRAGRSDDAAIS